MDYLLATSNSAFVGAESTPRQALEKGRLPRLGDSESGRSRNRASPQNRPFRAYSTLPTLLLIGIIASRSVARNWSDPLSMDATDLHLCLTMP